MTLTDWLQRLERLHYKAIDMGLERVSAVAQRLELLQGLPLVITVGGTNGKGSTVAFLESLLLAHGYSVGVYSSPHLIQFNERVRLNGREVDDLSLIKAFEQVEQARGDTSLTYFEFTTLAAMLIFRQLRPDVIVLEVGLGGRMDAVNIWDADIAAITAIDLDHQQFLGNTREQIGLEKLGIGRRNRPLVMGEAEAPTEVLQAAETMGVRLLQVGKAFDGQANGSLHWQFNGLDRAGKPLSWAQLPQTHLYWRNAAVALQILALAPLTLNLEAIRAGLANARLAGRQQIVQTEPDLMLDVGHNPHAAAHLARRLREFRYPRVHCVIGMLRDKAIEDTLAALLGVVDDWYPATLGGDRGLEGAVLANCLLDAGACVYPVSTSPHQACLQALQRADTADLVLIFGSFHTVADVIQYGQAEAEKG